MKDRLLYIDSIRGVSCLLVVYLHAVTMLYKNMSTVFEISLVNKMCLFVSFTLLDFGKMGVIMFFAVSGYVIPFSLLKYNNHNVGKFVISRVFRLYPMYWVSILIAVLMKYVDFGYIQLFANITMFQKYFMIRDLIGVYWTLQIEWAFYLLCIFFFVIGKIGSIRFNYNLSMALLILSLPLSWVRYHYDVKLPIAMPLSLSVMFWGHLRYRYTVLSDEMAGRYSIWYMITMFVIIFPISLLAYRREFGIEETWFRYVNTYIVSILSFYFLTTHIRITKRIIVFLGKISYSMYLIHPLVYSTIGPIAFDAPHGSYVAKLMAQNINYFIFASILAVVLLSSITYYLVEYTCVKYGRRFSARLFKS